MIDAFYGQTQAREMLSRSLLQDRVSHAYLFQGPSGVGKKKAAYAFAARLNCSAPVDVTICGQCSSCRKMAAGTHPDFITIEPDGAVIKIDQIRELKKKLTYPPFEAGYRVIYIADINVTMPRREVANSLLKTLEEPPASTVFILTSDDAADLLPTIISRCQVIPFYPLSDDAIKRQLCSQGVEISLAEKIAAISAGSTGMAEALCENGQLEMVEKLTETIVTLRANEPRTVEIIFTTAESMTKLKDGLIGVLELLKIWYGDCFKAHAMNQSDYYSLKHLQQNTDTAKQRWNLSALSDKVASIETALKQLKANCNKAFVCEVLLWNLIE